MAQLGEIPDGEGRAYPVAGRMVAVFRLGENYHAISDACPHMGASLAGGWVEEDAVLCPWHAWRFRVTDGAWLDSPKSKVRADCYQVRIAGNEIQVSLAPASASSAPPEGSGASPCDQACDGR